MSWTIDTGSVGAVGVAPSELKEFLENEQALFEKNALARAATEVLEAAGPGPADKALLPAHHEKLAKDLAAAKEAAAKKVEAAKPGIAKAIAAACVLAAGSKGNVCVTLQGHADANHASGVEQRLLVAVDSSPYVEG